MTPAWRSTPSANRRWCCELIEAGDFTAYPDALRFIIAVKDTGIRVAAASSSKNAQLFLRKIRLDTFAQEQKIASPSGETFIDLADAQRRAVEWCPVRAGRRIHGTHACRPVELFELEEKPRLLPAPAGRYDLPVYATRQGAPRSSHRGGPGAVLDPGEPDRRPGRRARRPPAGPGLSTGVGWSRSIPARRPAGGSPTPRTCPPHKTAYAMRDLDHLRRLAAAEGPAIGAYADALLDTPLPWTKMRQVYALLGPGQAVGTASGSRPPAPGRWRPKWSAWR